MEEKWKTIEGYQNYQVSNLGRVKSLNYRRTGKDKILKPYKLKNGYFQVNINKKGKRKHMYVHRLVGYAFVQNDSLFNTDINHKNECKTDNRATNLEWCTKEYNNNFGSHNERMAKSLTGVYNNIKKSKPVKCVETGVIYPSASEVQRQLGFSQSHICDCCKGKRHTCGGYHWELAI